MPFLRHIIMNFNDMIKLAQKPFEKKAQPVNTIYAYIKNIEHLLDRLESSELVFFTNEYISDLKNKINKLKQTFSSFKKSTQGGKGYASLNKKLPQIKAWLTQYSDAIGEGNAGDLLSDFQRIAKIFDETLPRTYEDYEERVDSVLEYGAVFAKKANAFLLSEEDVDLDDILTADDFSDAKDNLPEINMNDVPKKVLASMLSARKAYRDFFNRINAQMQEMALLLEELEAIDFLDMMEQFNKRNSLVKELINMFSAVSRQIEHPDNPKLEYSEMFEPKLFAHYRDLLKRAINFLPEDMGKNMLRQLDMSRINKIMRSSLDESRKNKSGDPEELFNTMAENDKKRKLSSISALDKLQLQAIFEKSLGRMTPFTRTQ